MTFRSGIIYETNLTVSSNTVPTLRQKDDHWASTFPEVKVVSSTTSISNTPLLVKCAGGGTAKQVKASNTSLSAFQQENTPPWTNPSLTIDTTELLARNNLNVSYGEHSGTEPISQTFRIGPEMTDGSNGLYVSGIDVYLFQASSTFGVTLEIRNVVDGVPAQDVLPLSRVHLEVEYITTSDDASVPVRFQFETPVYLDIDSEYCFTLSPDGNSPEYYVYTARSGEKDLINQKIINKDWGDGSLFVSTNDSDWTPVNSEDIKFTIWKAYFPSSSGYVLISNRDHEYFTTNTQVGSFTAGEFVFNESTSNGSGTITYTSSNSTITGSGTSFAAEFQSDDYITVVDGSGNYDVLQISAVASDTILDVFGLPRTSGSGVTYKHAPVGQVFFEDTEELKVVLEESTAANATFLFESGDLIRGEISDSTAVIETVDNEIINYYEPLIYRWNPEFTDIFMEVKTTTSAYVKDAE